MDLTNQYFNELSIADLNAIREYCLYQSEHRNWEFDKMGKNRQICY